MNYSEIRLHFRDGWYTGCSNFRNDIDEIRSFSRAVIEFSEEFSIYECTIFNLSNLYDLSFSIGTS